MYRDTWGSLLLDGNRNRLVEGTRVKTVPHGETGTVTAFDDLEPEEGLFQGQLTGNIVVEMDDGDRAHFPSYGVDADDVVYDLEALPQSED